METFVIDSNIQIDPINQEIYKVELINEENENENQLEIEKKEENGINLQQENQIEKKQQMDLQQFDQKDQKKEIHNEIQKQENQMDKNKEQKMDLQDDPKELGNKEEKQKEQENEMDCKEDYNPKIENHLVIEQKNGEEKNQKEGNKKENEMDCQDDDPKIETKLEKKKEEEEIEIKKERSNIGFDLDKSTPNSETHDKWNLTEMTLFNKSLIKYGRPDFKRLSRILGSKSEQQIENYWYWRGAENYTYFNRFLEEHEFKKFLNLLDTYELPLTLKELELIKMGRYINYQLTDESIINAVKLQFTAKNSQQINKQKININNNENNIGMHTKLSTDPNPINSSPIKISNKSDVSPSIQIMNIKIDEPLKREQKKRGRPKKTESVDPNKRANTKIENNYTVNPQRAPPLIHNYQPIAQPMMQKKLYLPTKISNGHPNVNGNSYLKEFRIQTPPKNGNNQNLNTRKILVKPKTIPPTKRPKTYLPPTTQNRVLPQKNLSSSPNRYEQNSSTKIHDRSPSPSFSVSVEALPETRNFPLKKPQYKQVPSPPPVNITSQQQETTEETNLEKKTNYIENKKEGKKKKFEKKKN